MSGCYAVEGPYHPRLGIAMDMAILKSTPSGKVFTLSLSFNKKGSLPLLCDNGTHAASYDDLNDGDRSKAS